LNSVTHEFNLICGSNAEIGGTDIAEYQLKFILPCCSSSWMLIYLSIYLFICIFSDIKSTA